jgi:hypothetical protein
LSTPDIFKSINHPNIATHGRTQRSAPTRRFFHRKSEIVSASLTARRDISIAQAHSHRLERKKKTLPAASRHREGPIFTNKQNNQTNNLAKLEANHIP